jgi:GNAT superfamily N-acetyltransferase
MIEIQSFVGAQVAPHLDAVAALRIEVFRDWPYLYAGDRGYEARYLATYAISMRSLFVLALDGGRVVGASTGISLIDEAASFHRPFFERDIALTEVFYFGESVLLPEYRGRGLGHRFFDERESHARGLDGFTLTAFCAVDRDEDDPRRPSSHRGNELFWTKRGYRRQHDMRCELDWSEVGQAAPTTQRMSVWLRALQRP